VQLPKQFVLERGAHPHERFAVVNKQPDAELDAGQPASAVVDVCGQSDVDGRSTAMDGKQEHRSRLLPSTKATVSCGLLDPRPTGPSDDE
jgi:hypothetical protein